MSNINELFDDIEYDEDFDLGEPDIEEYEENNISTETDLTDEEISNKVGQDNKVSIQKQDNNDIEFNKLISDENSYAQDFILDKKEGKEPEQNMEPVSVIKPIETEAKNDNSEEENKESEENISVIQEETEEDSCKKESIEDKSEAQIVENRKTVKIIYDDGPEPETDTVSEDEEPVIRFPIGKTRDKLKQNLSKWNTPENIKKIGVIAASVIVILLIPIFFAMASSSSPSKNKSSQAEKVIAAEPEEVTLDNTALNNLNTSNGAGDGKSESARFKTIDDLTLYIQSSTAYYLSTEKQAYNKYMSGTITKDDLNKKIQACTEKLNKVYHLLLINEAVYSENSITDTYETLSDNINEVFKYGDCILYN